MALTENIQQISLRVNKRSFAVLTALTAKIILFTVNEIVNGTAANGLMEY